MTATTANPAVRAAVMSSASDNWPTPYDFWAALDAEFKFVVDVCADRLNRKVPIYYGLDHEQVDRRDGLAGDWAGDAQCLGGPGGAVWMNPPYGRTIGDWMAKAATEAARGATVVCLVPVRADARWWHKHVMGQATEVRLVRGRLKFGDAQNSAPFASAVVVYQPGGPAGGTQFVGVDKNCRKAA